MTGKKLDGWGEIAARLSEKTGVAISVYQAMRYEDRESDPLPVLRIGRYERRRRIVADPALVDAWARREFGE